MSDFMFKIWNLAGPSAVVLSVLLIGTVLMWTGHARLGRWLCAFGTACFLAVTFLPIDSWALMPLEQRFPPLTQMPAHVDGVIVLGGSFDDSVPDARGLPSLGDSSQRMVEFARLARLYPKARLVFTGGSHVEPEKPAEADAAKQFMDDVGVDTRRIAFERLSRNTWQNALFSKDMIKPKPGETWLLVTSAVHTPRSVGIFRHVGWPVVADPAGYKESGRYSVNFAEHMKRFDDAMHEWQGLVAYRIQGRIDTLFPAP